MIRTSHVGSFPLEYSPENVEKVLVDLYEVGIDVPSYPQLRGFIDMFLKPLVDAGLLIVERGFFIVKHLDLRLLHGLGGEVEEAKITVHILDKRGLKFSALRAPVTGPFTLASRIYLSAGSTDLSNTLIARKDIVKEHITEYVLNYAKQAADLGYEVIFLDEPMLGVIVGARRNLFGYSDEEIISVLEKIAKSAPGHEFGIHVCGRVHRRLLEILSQISSVKYLSLEFHDNPSNIDVIDKELLELHDKVISPGVVSSRVPKLESVDEAFSILERIYKAAGGRVDLVSADCGFAGLKGALGSLEQEYKLALSKLRIVVEACRKLARAL